jgi:hypothetical protein
MTKETNTSNTRRRFSEETLLRNTGNQSSTEERYMKG